MAARPSGASADMPDDPLTLALRWHAEGRTVALATVIDTWGSAPRPAGSVMTVDAGGRIAGSVSGGCVEAAVVQAALEALADGVPRLLSFGVSDHGAWSVGLACGGTIRVLVGPIGDPEILRRLVEARRTRRLAVLATRLPDGLRVLLRERGGGLSAVSNDSAVPASLLAAAAERAVAGGRSRLATIEDRDWFLAPQMPAARLLVVGAVHIAQALVRMARLVGMGAVVIDPRVGLATPERFPDTELMASWPDEALDGLGIDRHSAVVTLTHDPKLDDPALDAALRSPAFHVGALGSRATQRARRDRLRALGHDADAVARIRGPVGLPIGAVGAEEIALSIVAELVAVRRGGVAAGRGG